MVYNVYNKPSKGRNCDDYNQDNCSQQKQPLLSVRVEVEELELPGSTHILNGNFDRIPLPKTDLPPVLSQQFASPEWTTPEDLIQMGPITEWNNGDEDFSVYREEMQKREFNLVYQAMLVRLRSFHIIAPSQSAVMTWKS